MFDSWPFNGITREQAEAIKYNDVVQIHQGQYSVCLILVDFYGKTTSVEWDCIPEDVELNNFPGTSLLRLSNRVDYYLETHNASS